MSYTIITDTSANLPSEYVMENKIGILPFTYFMDGIANTCLESKAFDGKTFYNQMREGKKVTTSQINSQSFIDYFTPILERGEDILFVSMSSGISGSYNSSRIAKEELEDSFPERKILLVDTKAASLGEGLFVYKAVDYKNQGKSIEENWQLLNDVVMNMYQLFTVDDLKYLRDGGRLSNASAIIGTLLNIKPILYGNEDGKIISKDKVRGRKIAIKKMAQEYALKVVDAQNQTIGISHGDCDEDAEYLISLINELNPPKQIIKVLHEPVTGAHVGPGMLSLFFWCDDKVRYQQRFKMRQNFNYHTHTYRCGHASMDSDEMYVQAAIRAGFKVLGFSDHAAYPDFSKPTDRMDYQYMEDYIQSILALKEKYKDQIEIHLGFEMEYMDFYKGEYLDYLLSRGEYLLLGEHNYLPDAIHDYCANHNSKEQLLEYARLCCEGMRSGKFLYLAHPDYFCGGIDEFDETCQYVAREIAKTAVETDTPLEVNIKLTQRPKKNYPDGDNQYIYPLRAFWKIVSEYPIKCVYGYDAHKSDLLENTEVLKIADQILEGLDLHFIDELPIKRK